MKREALMMGVAVKLLGVLGTSLLLALLIASHGPTRAVAGGPTVSISSVALAPGAAASVELQAVNIASPGLGAWSVSITYNPQVVSVTNCEAGTGGVCNPTFSADTIRVAGAHNVGLQGDTLLATIRFRCDYPGTSTLSVSVGTLADSTPDAPNEISATVQNGSIRCTVHSTLVGDVDCNGRVNAVDALLILQLVAGIIDSLPCTLAADVDDNIRINAVDVSLILQYDAGIIHSLPPTPIGRPTPTPTPTPSPILQPGEAIALVVNWWPSAQFPYHDVMNFQPSTCVASWTGAHWEVNCEAGILGDHYHVTFCVYEVTQTVGLC